MLLARQLQWSTFRQEIRFYARLKIYGLRNGLEFFDPFMLMFVLWGIV